jgi:hypothetical protein
VAEANLEGLVKAGFGKWIEVKSSTKPRREFQLLAPTMSTNSPRSREMVENVDVGAVDALKTDGDWLEI